MDIPSEEALSIVLQGVVRAIAPITDADSHHNERWDPVIMDALRSSMDEAGIPYNKAL